MNVYEARAIAALARFESNWESANPYESQCDETRCVRPGKCFTCDEDLEEAICEDLPTDEETGQQNY